MEVRLVLIFSIEKGETNWNMPDLGIFYEKFWNQNEIELFWHFTFKCWNQREI